MDEMILVFWAFWEAAKAVCQVSRYSCRLLVFGGGSSALLAASASGVLGVFAFGVATL